MMVSNSKPTNASFSIFLILFFLISTSNAARKPCARFCRLRLCGTGSGEERMKRPVRVLLREPFAGTPPFICVKSRKDPQITGIGADDYGEALIANAPRGSQILKRRSYVPISQYQPDGLSDPFPADYFRILRIIFPGLTDRYGIGRQNSVGNQNVMIANRCVFIPIRRYNITLPGKKRMRRVRSNSTQDCVAFLTQTTFITVELAWSSGDDLDLAVTEPDGNKIYYNNLVSPTNGRHLGDGPVSPCQGAITREIITFPTLDSNPLRGKYEVRVMHASNCGLGASNYSVAVVVNGTLALSKFGASNANNEAIVWTGKFRF